jgi:hypothetical protein
LFGGLSGEQIGAHIREERIAALRELRQEEYHKKEMKKE